jgi:hypothetical protein
MADLHKFTVVESLNTDTSAAWDVETVITTTDSTVTHINVSSYHNVIIDTTSTICILFDGTSNTTATDGSNLELPGGIHNIKVPHGVGRTVYLHWLRNGSSDTTVRLVLC